MEEKGILDVIVSRRSIRRYKVIPVEEEKILLVLEAARWAPSSGNVQNWKFIVVRDQQKIKQIAEAAFQLWVAEAPVLVIACADPEPAVSRYGDRGRFYTIQNLAAAIQNMLLEAHSLGLGTCWIGHFDEKRVKEILEIPESIEVHAIITLGYPDEEPKSERRDLSEIVYFEKWGEKMSRKLLPVVAYLERLIDKMKIVKEIIKRR